MQIQLACVQMRSELGDKGANLKKMAEYAHNIMKKHPDCSAILFPECAVTGYECPDLYESLSEFWPDGESLKVLSALAKELHVALVFGFLERAIEDGESHIYNSAALIENNGELLGRYRKAHLVEGMETAAFKKGDTFPVFDTSFGKVGVMICWDSVFPEVARMLAVSGAELILVPEAVEKGIEREWDLALAARAMDNVSYVISCNHAGTDRSLTYFGRSAVYAPLGELMAQAGEEEEILVTSVDYDLVHARREYFYMLRQRRPEVYGLLTKV